MVTLPPPQQGHPDMRYAMPPHDMYSPYGPPDPRTMGQPHMGYQSQPAPRQRTAIACRYCRRRKVRQSEAQYKWNTNGTGHADPV